MKFFVYAIKKNRLFAGYVFGSAVGARVEFLRRMGWEVHYREAA